jgi:hypothetical protein
MRGPRGIRQLARQNGQPANGTDRMITNLLAVLLAAAAIAAPVDAALRDRAKRSWRPAAATPIATR